MARSGWLRDKDGLTLPTAGGREPLWERTTKTAMGEDGQVRGVPTSTPAEAGAQLGDVGN